MLWDTPRTLPSPNPTCMVPLWPPCVTYQLHAWAEGPAEYYRPDRRGRFLVRLGHDPGGRW
jgi:hypothetical protein